jgi:hypothetical protein
MENSSITELGASDYDNLTFTSKLIVVVPDYINLITLFFGMYGMHQGIEIQHPLYSLLFINLFVSWFSSVINCIAFVKCPNLIYLKVTNIGCTLVLYFHSICWFLTTVIRHIYIVHDVWLHTILPNVKDQFWTAIGSALILTLALASPTFGYSFSKGKFQTNFETMVDLKKILF